METRYLINYSAWFYLFEHWTNYNTKNLGPDTDALRSVACVAGGFGGRESQAKTSGGAAGEMGREQRQSRRSRVNERLRREEPLAPFPRGFATRFDSRARLSGEPPI